MIQLELLTDILDLDNEITEVELNDDIDEKAEAVKLLRDRVPCDVCPRIIQGADHDIVYLPDPEDVIAYLSEDDAMLLRAYGVFIHDGSTLAMFV